MMTELRKMSDEQLNARILYLVKETLVMRPLDEALAERARRNREPTNTGE